MASEISIRPVIGQLPMDFAMLRVDAAAEGYDHIERLAQQWEAGSGRFEARGEALVAAYVGGELAGVGGITVDPYLPEALRMRRFYVRPAFRRFGIGRQLAVVLIEGAVSMTPFITLNAGSDEAAAFWERLGFVRDASDGHTHRLEINEDVRRAWDRRTSLRE